MKQMMFAEHVSCKLVWLLCSLLFVMAGCASVSAADTGGDLQPCKLALQWERAGSDGATRIEGQSETDEAGRRYDFDLAGRGGLQSLRAECGAGSYAACTFHATRINGEKSTFSELSTFALWERNAALYLVYRIVDPKNPSDAAKRRLVKVDNPPVEVCNEIGDYSELM